MRSPSVCPQASWGVRCVRYNTYRDSGEPGGSGRGECVRSAIDNRTPHRRPRTRHRRAQRARQNNRRHKNKLNRGPIHVFLWHSHTNEQALVCLSNREIVDASRGRTFHCKMANNRFGFKLFWPNLFSHLAAFNSNGKCTTYHRVDGLLQF